MAGLNNPIELFAAQIARAGNTSFRLLRGLQPADKEDVLQSAVLAAWEQRAAFDPSKGSLGAFFYGFLKSAVRDLRRAAARNRALEDAPEPVAPDDTVREAAIEEAQDRVLSRVDRRALELLADGCSAAEIAETCGLSVKTIVALARRLKRAANEVVESPAAIPTVRGESEEREPSRIDREIARLDFPPKTGKECPPCIHCTWFYGFQPGTRRSVAAEVVSAEVRAAQAAVYTRKVEISAAVRGERVSVKPAAESAAYRRISYGR